MSAESATTVAGPEELAGRLLEATIGAMDIFSVYLGEKLGYYHALHEGGPATSTQLAQRTGTHERYAREWLEQQATTGFLIAENPAASASDRRYRLPEGYEEVLVNPESEMFVAPVGRFVACAVGQAGPLLEAYRTGGGVPWAQFGDDALTAQSDFNRPFFMGSLVPGYLAQVPGLDAALKAPGARVAEVGYGGGWASIAIAKAYPGASVEGFDIDEESARLATKNAAAEGVSDRVTFHATDGAQAAGEGQFDLVCAFECIHDMSDPVSVLGAMRKLSKPEGSVLVMDEKVGDAFGNVGDFNERFFYGFSIAICLPDGMSHQPSAGTGTVMRPGTLKQYAKQAGFSDVEVLPLEHDLFRFYKLNR